MDNFYNGYSSQQREAMHQEQKRLEELGELATLSYFKEKHACAVCADPQRNAWHFEDYSRPFLFAPPACHAICTICLQRLHKRFTAPQEWRVFLAHVRKGGYGREFTALYSQEQRREWAQQVQAGQAPELPMIRARKLHGSEWWQGLSLEPDALRAPWARPRPLRPRLSAQAYRAAIAALTLTAREIELLVFHANSPQRTTTLTKLSTEVFASSNPATAGMHYGALAQKICEQLRWAPDRHADGSPVWMSVIAEGWQPEGREFEWSMIPALAEIYRGHETAHAFQGLAAASPVAVQLGLSA